MDFDQAVNAHAEWKARLLAAVDGTTQESLDPKVVGADDKCALGKWIHGEAKVHSSLPEFKTLVSEHASFHKCAAHVLALASQGKQKEAAAEVEDGEFFLTSIRTRNAIRGLQRKVT